MAKIKVIHFYAGNRFGGIEKFLLNLQRFAPEAPHLTQSFLLCFEGKLETLLRKEQAPLSVLGAHNLKWPWRLIGYWWQLQKHLKKTSCEILICHEIWNYVLAWPVARYLGTPLVLWCHNASFGYWRYRMLRFMAPDLMVANSYYVHNLLNRHWPAYSKDVLYCPHPDPTDGENPSRQEQEKNAKPIILFVGRLSPIKGVHVLLQAMIELKDLSCQLQIVGGAQTASEEKYLEELRQFVNEHGLQDKVQFCGEQIDVGHFYASARVFCSPNLSPEGFGLVFIEALYAGLPVVTSDLGGASEIFESGSRGYAKLIKPNDPKALAEALHPFLKQEKLDEECRLQARLRARKLCGPQEAMAKIDSRLERLIKSL